jgi:flavin reductase (DIM6/NTAB) family NADH-FMN oxidoreductase RutF
MTCNSFTSVSLEPPLVAFCPARSSETWPGIREAGRFVANIMGSEHVAMTRGFSLKNENRFQDVAVHRRSTGIALDDALAWIECDLCAEHDAGDHTIVISRVIAVQARRDVDPLVFYRGHYGTFAGFVAA